MDDRDALKTDTTFVGSETGSRTPATETDVDRWLDRTIAETTEAGAFGPDVRFVSFKLDSRHTGQDQFASTVLYGTVTISDGDVETVRRLVIKLKPREHEFRVFVASDAMFHNEIVFYERILPFLRIFGSASDGFHSPSLCRYFYGRNECGDHVLHDMIVLEDETVRGYRSAQCDHRVFMDYDHIVAALRALANFHGLSYKAKQMDLKKFTETINKIKETHWDANDDMRTPVDVIEGLFNVVMCRLRERRGGKNDERLIQFQSEYSSNIKQIMKQIMNPCEPMAVLCHGDFNRNNILFRYDDASGRPIDALAFDMATVRYGSPALDLSFFLYMNTDRNLREKHWEELLDEYSVTLANSVSDASQTIWIPDREQIETEMRGHAFYGLALVAFFMRILLDEENLIDKSGFINVDNFTMLQHFLLMGGNRATDVIADAFQHYIDLKYVNSPYSL